MLAAGCSFAITPVTARLARRWGILDHPSGYLKAHAVATPYLGGIAIVGGSVAGALAVFFLGESSENRMLLAGLGIAAALGAVGLVDDVRPLPRSVRLGAQLTAASGAWVVGFRVLSTPSDPLNFFITFVWIIGITNAFNLLDNMDGLTAGLAGIGALSFSVMAFVEGLMPLALLAAVAAAACFGFLAHNRHPAKIFMGDAGSLFLGCLLALIGIELRFDNLVKVTFLVPVVALGLPIFDTTLVVLSRLRARRSPFAGARDHLSHRLVALGFSVRTSVGLLYWSGLCLGWLGFVISRSSVETGWMLLAFVFAMGLFFGALVWRVPVVYRTPTDAEPSQTEADVPSSGTSSR